MPPRPEATPLDCAEDIVRVADHIGLERFSVVGASGGGAYAIALGASVPERLQTVAVVSGSACWTGPTPSRAWTKATWVEFKMAIDSPEELATALDDAARALREDPEGSMAGFAAGLPEVDRRWLEQAPDARALFVEAFREAVRQGGRGLIGDDLRLVRPWPFRLSEIGGVEVRFHHGEADVLVPAHHAKHLVEGIAGRRLRLYPGEGHLSIDHHITKIVEDLLAP